MANRLDSRALALFSAVADTQSFRQAAETLHLSQPPLSRSIRELEERLGTRLFNRNAKGVSLTDAGRKLLPYARRVTKLLEEAEAALSTQAHPATIRLGFTSAVEPPWFRGLAQKVQQACEGTAVTSLADSSPRLVRKVLAGKLDAAFVALPTSAPSLNVLELDRLPMVVALSTSHRLAKRKEIRLAELGEESVFWFERARQPAFYDYAHKVFARHGFAPGTLREPADHHVLLAAVAAGTGLALLPRTFTELKRSGAVYRRLAEGEELAVGIGLATLTQRHTLRDMLAGLAGAPGFAK